MSERIPSVLVTGASRGIGRGIAASLVREGRHVVGVARDVARLGDVRAELGDRFHPLALDVTTPGAVDALFAALPSAVGVPHGFVAAAGIAEYAAAIDVTSESLRRHLDVHVTATLELARALATRWIASGTRGSIVAVSSTLADKPAPYTLPYAIAKAALDAMVRGLALELAPHGIRANSVAPGVVDTEMVRAMRPDGSDPDERLRDLAARHPLGRLGSIAEVARTVAHVLDSEFMTGSRVVLDGGLSLT